MSREDGLRDAVVSWIAAHEDGMGSTQLRLCGLSGSSLLLEANCRRLHMSVPCSDEEAFLVTAADPDPDPPFDACLMILNEKFERLGPQPDALFSALDCLLSALKKFQQASTSCQVSSPTLVPDPVLAEDDDDDDLDDDGDVYGDVYGDDGDVNVDEHLESDEVDFGYDMASIDDARIPPSAFMELRYKSFLYAMAAEAKKECAAARRQFQKSLDAASMSTENLLAWCTVRPNPGELSIEINMQVGGIMLDDVAAASLGLSVDYPIHISLQIDKDLWGRVQPRSSWKIAACHVRAGIDQIKDSSSEGACGESNRDGDEGWDNDQRHKFGEETFVPELVFCFFRYLERKEHGIVKSSDVLKELQQFSAMRNPLMGLIHFLAARFRALPNWCIACWDTLPYQVGRLRTCDKDLCLYRFEELGLGTSILQEVHNSPKLIDFEISLAIAAAASDRDVFEPFPAFLLEKEEIRDRSGWFSKKSKPETSPQKPPDSSVRYQEKSSNKRFGVLRSILKAYPPLDEMQRCQDEKHLKKALAKLWQKALDANRSGVCEEWGRKPSLPYDVLRFLISSNRLTICPLEGSEELKEITNAVYQFAVLHDNPEKEACFERRRAEKGGSFFAFHGSPAGNWFSILRNGLRSLSNTRYMSTGAAYGAGIYTANDMATSLGYAAPSTGWKHGHTHGNVFSVLAICEIVNGSLVYKTNQSGNIHSGNIQVVRPECEEDISIRYLLVLTGDRGRLGSLVRIQQTQIIAGGGEGTDLRRHHTYLKELHRTKRESKWQELRRARWLSLLAMCNMEEEEEKRLQTLSHTALVDSKASRSSHGMPACMQAIQKELKNIISQINAAKRRELGQEANVPILALIQIDLPDECNLQRWLVDLSQDLFKETVLYQDLARRARQNRQHSTSVKLECVFPDAFPMAPPFIRVMSPRFRFHTGHITVGGSICMELLTESGWSPAFCFESVLVQIVSAMIEGGARLDFSSANSEYSVDEARMAFDRVARAHGWIKGN